MSLIPTAYQLRTFSSGRVFDDDGWILEDKECKEPSLVRAIYEKKQLILREPINGLYIFADWLPVYRMLSGSNPPVTYKSDGLAKKLGLSDLHITFSGYFPEKGAHMKSCSFKETEAYSILGRYPDRFSGRVLVVQSAGNTGRAFARVCSENKIPLLLCVPYDNISALWNDKEYDPCVKLVCSAPGSDYFDAIHLGNIIAKSPKFVAEGGAKNVARRDGMGTTVLSACTTIGAIPDFYFQAIGSGTGAIAAWEANLRLIEDGRFGSNKMRLVCSQNTPFLPMFDAWKTRSREITKLSDEEFRNQAHEICAKVLSNRNPPYGIKGGLFDALCDTDGLILAANNSEAEEAAKLFIETEGIDIHPAAAVATATLIQAVEKGIVKKGDKIMLNITGGGEERFKKEHKLFFLKPSIVFPLVLSEQFVLPQVENLF